MLSARYYLSFFILFELEAAFQWFLSLSVSRQWVAPHCTWAYVNSSMYELNQSGNPKSSSVHTIFNFQWLFGYSLSVA